MQYERQEVPHKLLVGITARTSFAKETNPLTSEITKLVTRYLNEETANKIPNRKSPGVGICAYTDYTNEYLGEYTYFIGEEVTEVDELPEGISMLEIPAGTYLKLTTDSGAMPFVIINAWQKIWQLFQGGDQGKRRYQIDFEVYDKRAKDPQSTIVDLFVGVE
ncbi:GyrI-like domain-containing protein [Candidatus Paracaedibacter symbiosus]|uniref:GyrI-like domain-containing protein n=1 Tax=Candidatus Paracaedibacter symbiosus TaxID=244582 RepID=UPI0005096BC6|nr:GyrI-like domain-containing protein [Candidatus Paracaedibacter symbiosus]